MFANYGTGEKNSTCANSSHFIPLLILSEGHHHLPHQGTRSQMVLALSIQNIFLAVHFFPRTRANEGVDVGHCVHVVRQSNSVGLFHKKGKKNRILPPPEVTIVKCRDV